MPAIASANLPADARRAPSARRFGLQGVVLGLAVALLLFLVGYPLLWLFLGALGVLHLQLGCLERVDRDRGVEDQQPERALRGDGDVVQAQALILRRLIEEQYLANPTDTGGSASFAANTSHSVSTSAATLSSSVSDPGLPTTSAL